MGTSIRLGRGRSLFWALALIALLVWPTAAFAADLEGADWGGLAFMVQLLFSVFAGFVGLLIKRSLNQADARAMRLEERLNHTREAYVTREKFDQELAKRDEVTDRRFHRLNGKVDRANDRIEQLTDRVRAVDGRLDRLESSVDELRSDTREILSYLKATGGAHA